MSLTSFEHVHNKIGIVILESEIPKISIKNNTTLHIAASLLIDLTIDPFVLVDVDILCITSCCLYNRVKSTIYEGFFIDNSLFIILYYSRSYMWQRKFLL